MVELSFSAIWIPIIFTLPMLFIFTAKDALGGMLALVYTPPIALIAWIIHSIFKQEKALDLEFRRDENGKVLSSAKLTTEHVLYTLKTRG